MICALGFWFPLIDILLYFCTKKRLYSRNLFAHIPVQWMSNLNLSSNVASYFSRFCCFMRRTEPIKFKWIRAREDLYLIHVMDLKKKRLRLRSYWICDCLLSIKKNAHSPFINQSERVSKMPSDFSNSPDIIN